MPETTTKTRRKSKLRTPRPTISEKSAVYAALIAYALPLAFTLAGLFIPLAAGAGEDTAAFSALAAPALYYLLLFFFRRHIGAKTEIKLR